MARLYFSPFLGTIGTLAVTAARWLTATVDQTTSTLFDPLDRLVVTFVATVERLFEIAFPPAPSPDLRFQDWLSELITGPARRAREPQGIRADDAPVLFTQYIITLSKSSSRLTTLSGTPPQSIQDCIFSTIQVI